MKRIILPILVSIISLNVTAENMTKYLKHSSGLGLGIGSSDRVVLCSTSSAKPLDFVQNSDGSFYISINDGGTTKYMTLGTANGWDTYFQTSYDTRRSRYTIENVDGKLIRLKNASSGKYLGTDGIASGNAVYSNKSGDEALHQWFLTDEANGKLPIDTLRYMIAPAQRLQETEGWGVSLCWWARMCGTWSDAKLDQLITWLVSPTGLNMNIFRYNIGGGDDPNNTHCDLHHMGNGKGLRAEMEGFQDEPGGAYHWERDSAQRRVMLKIKQKRPDAIFEAFSNSAPWWMTYSGCCAGAVNANNDNLKPEYYEAFAHYLVDVCKYYKDTFGIEFRTLEPFNESASNYWYANGSQEGCHFDPSSQAKFLKVLHPILQQSRLSTVISASDETDISVAVSTFKTMKNAGVTDMVGQWNSHTYHATNRARSQFGTLGRSTGKRVWMSEVGAGGSGISGNLNLMQKMFDDIHYIQPNAWIDWQYVEENGDQWCLVNAKFNNESSAQRVKSYYVRSQVTRYIQAGYHFIPSTNPNALAAVNPEGTKLIMVLLNLDSQKTYHRIQMPLTNIDGIIRFTHTTSSTNLTRATGHTSILPDSTLQVYLDPLSIATLEIPVKIKESTEAFTDGDIYMIIPQSNIQEAITAKNSKVKLAKLNMDDPAQQWKLTKNDQNAYSFTNGNGDVIGYRTSQYELVTRTKETPLLYKHYFQIEPADDSLYKIMYGTNAFDLQSNGLTEDTTIGMYTYGNSPDADTRNWYLIRIASDTPDGIKLPLEWDQTTKSGTEYYNLQGMRLNQPSQGINIRRIGTKIIKILIP